MSDRFNSHLENNVSELLSFPQFYVKHDQVSATALKVSLFKTETWSKTFGLTKVIYPLLTHTKNRFKSDHQEAWG